MKHQVKSITSRISLKKMYLHMFVLAFLFYFNTGAYAISFTFDDGLDGWTPTQPDTNWSSSGGNPAGYVSFSENTASGSMILAPLMYLGDWSAFAGTSSISFDHKLFSTGTAIVNILDYEILMSGSGSTARWTSPGPSVATDWVTLSASIEESAWDVTGSWSNLLTSIDMLSIRIELVDGPSDIAGIDNIFLPGNAPVPEPATMLLFGTGIVGLAGARLRRKKK